MNILVIDDEQLVGSLIRNFLSNEDIIDNVFWLNDISQIDDYLKKYNIRVVFLDLYLPKLEGFDILKSLKQSYSELKIIILSSHFEKNYIDKALEFGANGYLNKNINPLELKKSIDFVLNNKIYLCSECKQYKILEDEDELNPKELRNNLSEREIEVLKYISEGFNSIEISEKLFITPSTVEFHKKSLFKKFGTNKSTKMVKIAVSYNII